MLWTPPTPTPPPEQWEEKLHRAIGFRLSKKGDKANCADDRTLWFIPIVSRLVAKFAANRMQIHVGDKSIFPEKH